MYRILMRLSLILLIMTPVSGIGVLLWEINFNGYCSGMNICVMAGFATATFLSFVFGIVYGLAKGAEGAIDKMLTAIAVVTILSVFLLVGPDVFFGFLSTVWEILLALAIIAIVVNVIRKR